MSNFLEVTGENTQEHNARWTQIPGHLYRIQTECGSGPGKTNAIIDLINQQSDVHKIFLYAKDLNEPKYRYLKKA